MTIQHSTLAVEPLPMARKFRVAAGVMAITATLAACSPSTDEAPASADAQEILTQDAVAAGTDATEESDAATEGSVEESSPDAPDAGAYTSDDVGNGTLHVDGVEFPDFTGDCEISRQNGKEDVGDLNEGDIVTIIAIDNVKAHEDSSMNYVALNEESFRFSDPMGAAGVGGPTARGEITSLTELGPRTADGSRDIVEVRFAGALEDGTTVDADVVCELQNAF
ncbi:hypothetical protein [Demequina aurantiaca]|uniref:hypothetical protein n=1 Tax=Demequina aurantiaca TaxID=676200 RepID=UPI003D335266